MSSVGMARPRIPAPQQRPRYGLLIALAALALMAVGAAAWWLTRG